MVIVRNVYLFKCIVSYICTTGVHLYENKKKLKSEPSPSICAYPKPKPKSHKQRCKNE